MRLLVALTLVIGTLCSVNAGAHDFYISICTIKHDTAMDQLQITIKLTTHDMEYALEDELGGIAHFGSDLELEGAEEALKAHLLENLIIRTRTSTLDIEYLGKEVEFEDMYCYLEVNGLENYLMLEVKNSILFSLTPKQSNIIHLENTRGRKTQTATPGAPVVRFTP